CQPLDALRAIERKAVRAAGAAIVAAYGEALEAELPHQLDLVTRHRPLRVGLVIRRGLGLRALAVAAQVRRDDGEALCQCRGDGMPHHVRLRMAVQEEERRSATSVADPQ